MKNLNRLAFLLLMTGSLSVYSQMSKGGFKLTDADDVNVVTKPEVLLSFDALLDDKKVELTWASNTENNNNFFTIEKSKDAVNFEEVTTIKGFGNNSNIISYFDVDYIPFDGISYYRLKQTGTNGAVLSSRIVSVNNTNRTAENLSLNSTILEDNISNLLGYENKQVLVVLRNEKGVETYSKVYVDPENNIEVADESENKLENGTYVVVASSDNRLYSQKVVVR